MGLIAATTMHAAQIPQPITSSILIGIDLGPNLSVTGSLATILVDCAASGGRECRRAPFLRLGFFVMPPALLLTPLALSPAAP